MGGASSDDVELRMDQCMGMEWLDERVCVYVSACPAVMPCLLFVLVLVSCFVVFIVCPGAVPTYWYERTVSLHRRQGPGW